MSLDKYFDKHKDETIFILGNSDELNQLTKEQIKDLEDNYTTIGVNYSHMVVKSNYMITGHMSHIFYLNEYGGVKTLFFQTYANNNVFQNSDNVVTIFCDYGEGDTMKKQPSRVEGCANICISASHLAYLMGAKRVVYLGFNQRNLLHFYDTNEEIKELLLSNIKKIREKTHNYPPSIMSSVFNDYDAHINNMSPGAIKLRELEWTTRPNNPNNTKVLTNMFNTMKSNGIEIVSTEEDSIMVDSGATHIPLNEILK